MVVKNAAISLQLIEKSGSQIDLKHKELSYKTKGSLTGSLCFLIL
jgi:hypothetical protein